MSGVLVDGVRHDRPETPQHPAECDSPARTRLLQLSVGLVEDLRSAGPPRQNGAERFSPEFQLVLPYRGMHVWHVGRDDVVSDANQVLFVTGGEGYRVSHPVAGGYDELIVTPELRALSEIANTAEDDLPAHPLFRRRSRHAHPRLQSFRTRFLYWARGASDVDDLAAEELVLTLLRAVLDGDAPSDEPCGGSTLRLIRRTKAFLEAELANPIRLTDGACGRCITGLSNARVSPR